MDEHVLWNLQAPGADLTRLPETIPDELADYITKLPLEDIARIRADVREPEQLGLLEGLKDETRS